MSGVCDLPGERCNHPISCSERGCVKQRSAPPMNPHQKPQEDVVGLLPCPFCGGEALATDDCSKSYIACSNDDCWAIVETTEGNLAEAIARWNTRAAPTYEAGRRDMREEAPSEDWLAEVLDDSLDMDWTGRVGAQAIIREWNRRYVD